MKKITFITAGALIILLMIIVGLAINIILEQGEDIKKQKYRPLITYEELRIDNEIEFGIFNLINIARTTRKLPELEYNALLVRAGENHCKDILEYGYWQHSREGKKFSDFADELGIEYKQLAENLATDYLTTGAVVGGWLESKSHREALLGDYNELGVGVVKKDDGKLLVSAYFKK